MTDQQIIDNNKLIAEFMGYRHKGKPMAFMAINYKKLYHKDWNWLMPVVEKMNKIMDIILELGMHKLSQYINQ